MRLELKHQGTTMQLQLALDDDRLMLTSPVTLDTPWSTVAVRTRCTRKGKKQKGRRKEEYLKVQNCTLESEIRIAISVIEQRPPR